MIGLFTGDMIENSISFYNFYTTPTPKKPTAPAAGKKNINKIKKKLFF
jgi:hypothetical protein